MKKLIINILCFSIFFNSFIGILSKAVYALENDKRKIETLNSNSNKEERQKIDLKNINKEQFFTFAAIGIGIIMVTSYMRKICCQINKGINKLPGEPSKNIIEEIIEEEEEDRGE